MGAADEPARVSGASATGSGTEPTGADPDDYFGGYPSPAAFVRALVLAVAVVAAFAFGGLALVGGLVGVYLLTQLIEAVRHVERQLEELNERLPEDPDGSATR